MSENNGNDVKVVGVKRISVSVPVWSAEDVGYVPIHVSPGLDARQGQALKRLWTALDQSGTTLANGRPVASYADAIRYMLEQFPEKTV